MATTFPYPSSPTGGQVQALTGGKNVVYNSTLGRWESTDSGAPMPWRTVTSSQILSSTDEDGAIIFNSASALTATLNPNATTPYGVGRSTVLMNKGAGTVTIVLGSGVTGNKKAEVTLVLNGVNSQVSVSKSATDVWEITGDLVSA